MFYIFVLFKVCFKYTYNTSNVLTQGKWEVPLPKVKGMSETEVFKVVKTGKSRRKFHIYTGTVLLDNKLGGTVVR